MQRLFSEKAYKDQAMDDAQTFVAWSGNVTSAERIEGVLLADQDLRIRLQALRPNSNPQRIPSGTVLDTVELDDAEWITVEDTSSQDVPPATDVPYPYSWRLTCVEMRLILENTSGNTATFDMEVNSRNA